MKISSLLSTVALGFGFAVLTAQTAQANTLFDFDSTGLADGQRVTNQIAGMSIINGQIGYEGGSRNSAVGFWTRRGLADDSVDPNKTADGAAFSGGFLRHANRSGNLIIDFDNAVSGLSFTAADIEGRERLTASVFDSAGNSLGSKIVSGGTDGAGDASALFLSFDIAGISRLVLDPANGNNQNRGIGYAIDNLAVNTTQSVPEPSVLLGSLGVVGMSTIVKRKRSKA